MAIDFKLTTVWKVSASLKVVKKWRAISIPYRISMKLVIYHTTLVDSEKPKAMK
jgi:hypothetical protein